MNLNTVIGRTKDKNGTSWVGENTRAPYVTVIGESEDGFNRSAGICSLT
ncbi:major tail protein [Staphylococcus aureus]|uniref:Major tail protein n=1 Tax=Staphylococcus aureus TaxID=1280 RepID=A0A380EEV8_STAAU|nr:major tail protein [Staphylococcus aureus]